MFKQFLKTGILASLLLCSFSGCNKTPELSLEEYTKLIQEQQETNIVFITEDLRTAYLNADLSTLKSVTSQKCFNEHYNITNEGMRRDLPADFKVNISEAVTSFRDNHIGSIIYGNVTAYDEVNYFTYDISNNAEGKVSKFTKLWHLR